VPDTGCLLGVAVAALVTAAPTTTQAGAAPGAGTNWMPAAIVVAAVLTVMLGRLVSRRKDRVDLLDKQQQMLERQLRIEEAQERQADRLRERTRELEEWEERLRQQQAELDELSRRRNRRPGGGGDAS
jgi:hypothetical protein